MTRSSQMSLYEIRMEGWKALTERLGPAGAMRFMMQYDPGRGDYSKARDICVGDWKSFSNRSSEGIPRRNRDEPHASVNRSYARQFLVLLFCSPWPLIGGILLRRRSATALSRNQVSPVKAAARDVGCFVIRFPVPPK